MVARIILSLIISFSLAACFKEGLRGSYGTGSQPAEGVTPIAKVVAYSPGYLTHDGAPDFGDLDGDGDEDLILGLFNGSILYYENQGGKFIHKTGADNPFDGFNVGSDAEPSVVDIDGDGDFDLFFGNTGGTYLYFENQGTPSTPSFVQIVGAGNPLNGIDVGFDSSVDCADIDNDGDFDCYLGRNAGTLRYYRNDGDANTPNLVYITGAQDPMNGESMTGEIAPRFVDIDGDGDQDLFAFRTISIYFYENEGTASAPVYNEKSGAANPLLNFDPGLDGDLSFVDIDKDGDFDVFLHGKDNSRLYIAYNIGNATTPNFSYGAYTNPFPQTVGVTGIVLACLYADRGANVELVDLDNDSKLEVIYGDRYGNIGYYDNTGTPTTPNLVELTGGANPFNGLSTGNYAAPTLADIDNDGDFDLIAGENSGAFIYFRNDGSSSTPSFSLVAGASNPLNGEDGGTNTRPVFVDIDNDGDFDLFVSRDEAGILFYENTGTAFAPIFTLAGAHSLSSFAGTYSTIKFIDHDRDGDLDAIIGYSNYPNQSFTYYENIGSKSAPVFTEQTGINNPLNNYSMNTTTFFTGDIDGDDDVDLFLVPIDNDFTHTCSEVIFLENTYNP